MKNREYLTSMFELQQSLNDETNGIGWEKGYTKTNNIINWRRCVYMECAELINSFNWKHWKDLNKPIDWENARVEIVDIWHFIMSLILERYKLEDIGGIDKIVSDIENVKGFKEFCGGALKNGESNSFEIINDIETLINKATSKDLRLFDPMLKEYFTISLKCGVNLQYLYKYYVAKNILNRFRQNHGYKEGIYKKIWNGKEDNVVMLELLNQGIENAKSLYERLESIYKSI
jgi:dimeric dUTPase (all-alpha-NTP-PPase superfamily)